MWLISIRLRFKPSRVNRPKHEGLEKIFGEQTRKKKTISLNFSDHEIRVNELVECARVRVCVYTSTRTVYVI